MSVNCWQTVGCLLGHSQATVHGLLAISQLIVGPQPAERVFQRVVLHNYLQLFLGFFFFLVFALHLLQEKIPFQISCARKKDNCGTKSDNNFGFRFTVGDN